MTSKQVSSLPDSIACGRIIKAIHAANGDLCAAASYAEGQREAWRGTPQVFTVLRTAVTALTSNASPLAVAQDVFADFLPIIRARTLVDRIPGFRRVPQNVSVLRYTSDATGAVVAEGAAVPVSAFSLERTVLAIQKIAALTVVTKEALLDNDPNAEASLASQLAGAVGRATDNAMFAVDVTGSIANSGTIIVSAGSTLANIDADLKLMLAAFAAGDSALDRAVFVMAPSTAAYMATLRGTGGALAYPNLGARGGELFGLPVFVSAALKYNGSPDNTSMTLFDPGQVLLADPAACEVTTTTQATLQQDSAATINVTTPTAASLVSLYQANAVGILGCRWVNWKLSSATGAVTLNNLAY